MGLFGKDSDNKEFEQWSKEKALKEKEAEKQKQKEQLNEVEDVDDFEVGDSPYDISLANTVTEYANINGIMETIQQLDYIKNELLVQEIKDRLKEDIPTDKDDKPIFKEE